MKGLEGVTARAVACGWRHSMVVDDSGKLYSCGWSKYGQLGHGDFDTLTVMAQVMGLQDETVRASHKLQCVAAMVARWVHARALLTCGTTCPVYYQRARLRSLLRHALLCYMASVQWHCQHCWALLAADVRTLPLHAEHRDSSMHHLKLRNAVMA